MAALRRPLCGALVLASSITGGEGSSGHSPVRKVVKLLEEMKAQVEKEGKQAEEAAEKYMCGCETTEKQKGEAIDSAEQAVDNLDGIIKESAGMLATLEADVEALTSSISEDSEALRSAEAMHQREQQDFEEEEADLKETHQLLKEAIDALSKVQLVQQEQGSSSSDGHAQAAEGAAAALVQVQRTVFRQYPKFQSLMQKDLFDMIGSLNTYARSTAADKLEVQGFLSSGKAAEFKRSGLLPWEKRHSKVAMAQKVAEPTGAAAGAQSYDGQSGRIFGLLSQMHDEVAADLADAQKANLLAETAFQRLRASKMGEVAVATEQKKRKEADIATTTRKSAEAKEDREATAAAAEADRSFVSNLKKDCEAQKQLIAKGVSARNDELQALSEATRILTEDDARAVFAKSMSFVQLGESTMRRQGSTAAATAQARTALQHRLSTRAMHRLAQAAKRHKDWALASLAVRVHLDDFTKVKAAMDKMIASLQRQQKEDVEKKETCAADIDRTEDQVKEEENENHDLSEALAQLKGKVQTLEEELAQLKEEDHAMQVSLKQAGEARKAENGIYKAAIMDQRSTANILQKALARLEKHYALVQAHQGAHEQVPGRADAPPPPKVQAYQKAGGAGGVLQLLSMIIRDTEVEATALESEEQHAQEAYARLVREADATLKASREAQVEKQAALASANSERSETQEALTASGLDLDKLNDLLKAHHIDCDYFIKYFKVRQDARAEEMDAISDAKAILSGADYGK